MMDANVTYYNEYGDIDEDRYIMLEVDGVTYIYDSDRANDGVKILDRNIENYNNYYFNRFFMQRPDVKLLYKEISSSLTKTEKRYEEMVKYYNTIMRSMNYSPKDLVSKKLEEVKLRIETIEEEIEKLKERKNKVINDVYDYNRILNERDDVNKKLEYYSTIYNGLNIDETIE